ncbi:hypothetical protein SAMN04515656_12612 [Eubacterium aggregans]|uniref:Phosphatidylglycerol lysyltransferase n=1 Tax=Eubacterium aggregans TaxID=81409 RepID=A0A1H4DN35_9FIRM|nr:lysylphosphatidylglycerol synthase transmembrane domain-containing protein [Eubacterium aggregans]SEA73938.1 hypothetical protein SAMN04515656_12612 [Eubacterium aggregans]
MGASIKRFLKEWGNYIILLVVLLITFFVLRQWTTPRELLEILKQSKPLYLAMAILAVAVYVALEAYMLMRLMRHNHPRETAGFSFTLAVVGQFYNNIDPTSSGGQPMQLYEMSQRGYSVGTGTAVLMQKYVLYEVAVTAIAGIAAFFASHLISGWGPDGVMVIIGLIINGGMVVVMLFLLVNAVATESLAQRCIVFFEHVGIIKNKERWKGRVSGFFQQYQVGIEAMKKNMGEAVVLTLLSIIQMIIYFSVTYWIYRALGMSGLPISFFILRQALLYVSVAFIPTPGSAGGAEAVFLMMFGSVFGAGTPVAMIIWRFITFYLILILGGIYVGIFTLNKERKRKGRKNKRRQR